MGKCIVCDYMYSNDTMGNLYICVNGNSDHFRELRETCSDYDCPNCVVDGQVDRGK